MYGICGCGTNLPQVDMPVFRIDNKLFFQKVDRDTGQNIYAYQVVPAPAGPLTNICHTPELERIVVAFGIASAVN